MIAMLNFVGYMIFSGFEYLALFFLIFSFFNLSLNHYIKEITFSVLTITLVSYLLVILNVYQYVPLPLIIVPVLIVIMVKVFKMKVAYSTVTIAGSVVFYGILQVGIAYLSTNAGFIEASQINEAFGVKTYTMQTLCASVASVIGWYIKYSNSGFGFSFRSKKKDYKNFVVASVTLIVVSSFAWLSFYLSELTSLVLLSIIVFILSSVIFFYLSYKRDQVEFC